MKRLIYTIFVGLAVLLVAGCAPSKAETVTTEVPRSFATATSQLAGVTAIPTALPLPQATSHGDKLIVSDPASVQVNAGQPVLIEFFRFT